MFKYKGAARLLLFFYRLLAEFCQDKIMDIAYTRHIEKTKKLNSFCPGKEVHRIWIML